MVVHLGFQWWIERSHFKITITVDVYFWDYTDRSGEILSGEKAGGKGGHPFTTFSQQQHFGQFEPDNSFGLWGCPVHCKMITSIPGLSLPNASSTHPQLWPSQLASDIAKCPLVFENTALSQSGEQRSSCSTWPGLEEWLQKWRGLEEAEEKYLEGKAPGLVADRTWELLEGKEVSLTTGFVPWATHGIIYWLNY